MSGTVLSTLYAFSNLVLAITSGELDSIIIPILLRRKLDIENEADWSLPCWRVVTLLESATSPPVHLSLESAVTLGSCSKILGLGSQPSLPLSLDLSKDHRLVHRRWASWRVSYMVEQLAKYFDAKLRNANFILGKKWIIEVFWAKKWPARDQNESWGLRAVVTRHRKLQ